MAAILTKVGGFLFLIALGYFLKRMGVFCKEDGIVLSHVIVNVTVCAAILNNFQNVTFTPELAAVLGVSFAVNFGMLLLGWLIGRGLPPDSRVLCVLNTCTFNLGTFALPFLQAFYSGLAIVIVCIFDIACAVNCFGSGYAVACAVSAKGRGAGEGGLRFAVRMLLSSPPFVIYLVLLALLPFQARLPGPVLDFASMVAGANTPLAMLMLGILFELRREAGSTRLIVRILACRYLAAAALACAIYFLLPLPQLYRQVMAMLVFSPISSIAPVFTAKCGVDPSSSAVMNSLCIPISVLCMTGVMLLTAA